MLGFGCSGNRSTLGRRSLLSLVPATAPLPPTTLAPPLTRLLTRLGGPVATTGALTHFQVPRP